MLPPRVSTLRTTALVVWLGSVTSACGAHTIISLEVTATRAADDRVTLHAIVECNTMNAGPDCLGAGDYCLEATFRYAGGARVDAGPGAATIDDARLCRTNVLSSNGARDGFTLTTNVAIPSSPAVEIEARLRTPDGAPLAYDYGDQDVTIPAP